MNNHFLPCFSSHLEKGAVGVGDYFFVYSDFVFASTNVGFYRFRMVKDT